MELSMHMHRKRRALRRLLTVGLTVLTALLVTGAASAEFPYMNVGPSIVGGASPQEGQTLQGRTGLWLFTSGLKCETGGEEGCNYTYSWQRCEADGSGCTDIPGETGFSLLLKAADVGKRIRFIEWVKKYDCGEWNYSTGTRECRWDERNGTSDLTEMVQQRSAAAPAYSAVPTVSGLAMEDEVLTARGGTWTGQAPLTKTWQWQRCSASDADCANVAGATASTYKLAAADVGSKLRVVEIVTNAGGSNFAGSTLTATVAELRPTAAKRVIPVTKVVLPHQLLLDGFTHTRAGNRLTVRFRVSDDRGFRISGALVGVEVVPGSGAVVERRTNSTGWATFRYRLGPSPTLYFYVTARKPGEKLQSGVSTSTLYRLRLR
jgi:hypothetical protein